MSANRERAQDQSDPTGPRIVVHGFTTLNRPDIADALCQSDFRALTTGGGSYVLVAEESKRVVIITSCDGARPYFYTVAGGRLYHAATVLDVVREASLPWRWNWRALGDLFALEHLVSNDTLHQDVFRTSPASALIFERGRLNKVSLTFAEAYPGPGMPPDQLMELTVDLTLRWAGDQPTLSASAGFDSRLLLAAMLNRGVRPRLLVAGDPKSSDRMVGEAIARRLGLELIAVTLEPSDWIAVADEVVALTGGSKPAQNWHTYIYPRRAGLGAEDRLIIGSNGELLRTFYLDYGIAARVAAIGPARWLLREFWRRKMRRAFRPEELPGLAAPLADELGAEGQRARVERFVAACDGGLLSGLDRFYLRERVRHFIGNGIALYEATTPTITPMLDREWTRSALALPRRWKLGNRWHRSGIERLAPELLEFPEQYAGDVMRSRPTPLYWVTRRHGGIGFADYNAWFRQPLWLELIRDLSDGLGLIDRQVLDAALREQTERGGRGFEMSVLFALVHFAALVQGSRGSEATAGPGSRTP